MEMFPVVRAIRKSERGVGCGGSVRLGEPGKQLTMTGTTAESLKELVNVNNNYTYPNEGLRIPRNVTVYSYSIVNANVLSADKLAPISTAIKVKGLKGRVL